MRRTFAPLATAAAAVALLAGASGVHAQSQPAPAAPAAPAAWADTIKFSGHIEAGITFNADDPKNGLNFGHLFTDRSNSPLLNQALLTLERDVDPKATGYDFGFKLQGMYGSDARYTHFLGELDKVFRDRNQVDIVEANVSAHLPLLTAGGIDAKVGQYPTPIGAEVIDATGNFFYSHSYIFNFGIPLKHTGFYTTTHVTDMIDVWLGADSGVNTSLGNPGDNNDAWSGLGGIGLNLMGGNLTILGLAHIGPENPRTVPQHNSTARQIYDVVAIWKVNDKLTSTTEVNYIRDDFFHATAEGVATYLSYTINDNWSVGGRAEVFRDDQGFFVAAFPSATDFVNVEQGLPSRAFSGGKTTYGELTFGVNFKPAGVPKMFDGFVIRPEIRWDQALATSTTKPFNSLTSDHQFTFAADFILPF